MTRTSNHTAPGTHSVPVAQFRALTDRLFRSCRVDLASAANHAELQRWVAECRSIACQVREAGCARARLEDWDSREGALDLSASLICGVLDGKITRRAVAQLRLV